MSKRGKIQKIRKARFVKGQSKKHERFKGYKLLLLSFLSGGLFISFLLLPSNWDWLIAKPYGYLKRMPMEMKNRNPDHRKEVRFGYSYLFARGIMENVPKGKRILMPPQALLIHNYCKEKTLNEMNFDFIDFSLDLLMLHHTQDYTFLHMGMEESEIKTADFAFTSGTVDQPVQIIEIKDEKILNDILSAYEPYLDFPTKNWSQQEMYDLVQEMN